jgi:hypothetical protein
MLHRNRLTLVLLSLCVAALLASAASACGGGGASASPSPTPAPSVSALPGNADAARIVTVFIKDGASAAQKLAMAHQIAQMPEVEAYHFVTKREALDRFAKRFGEDIVANLPVNPLPASFQILVRNQADVAVVARRF